MKPAFEDTLPVDKPPFEETLPIEQSQTSNAGSIISGMARPMLEMGGAVGGAALGGAADVPTGIIPGAITGGAVGYGIGKSAADLLDRYIGTKQPIQNLPEAAQETTGNLVKGAGVEATNLVLNPVIKGLGTAAIKGASAYFGPSEEAIAARIENPDLQNYSYPQTAQNLADHLNKLQTNLNDVEDKVWGSLLKLKAEPKSSLLGMINNIKGQIKVTNTGEVASDADQTAIDALDRLSGRIKNMGTSNLVNPTTGKGLAQYFDQNQLREILQSVSKDINWEDPYATSKNKAMTSFRHYLSEYLKNENPQYADLIQQSADRTSLLENAQHAFSLEKPGGKFSPSDATTNKIKNLLNQGKLQSQKIAGRVNDLTGMDLANEAQMSKYAGEFEKTATQGSRRAKLGQAVGAGIGAVAGHSVGGGAIGAMVGGYLDKYAAQNLGATIDAINRLGLTDSIPAGPLGLAAGVASLTDNQ